MKRIQLVIYLTILFILGWLIPPLKEYLFRWIERTFFEYTQEN